jgi:hypothetical protein
MRRLNQYQSQKGFLTIAQNSGDVDYLRMAYAQAMSIKLTMPGSLYAVVVDKSTAEQVLDKHRRVFDYVIELDDDASANDSWKFRNEWKVAFLTPFKETIKVESDLVFTRSIEHWWTAFRLKDIVLSTGCRDYLQNKSGCRDYRKIFDDNELPDVYNGLMYFRYSPTSSEFFWIAQHIFENWEMIRDTHLVNCRDPYPSTDVVYALSAKLLGVEKCTMPSMDFINFVHMKSKINGFREQIPWHELVVCETELPMIRINNINQYHPLHYFDKDWLTDDIVEEYEHALRI